jgi:hypothetical protein
MFESKINVGLINMVCPQFLEKASTPAAQEAARTLSNIFYQYLALITTMLKN